ncbi:Uncharacterised protein [Candidatus Bilamarchaeum dharawalense]|uniref:Uncharacterized protein n=1 Tax=Candidatus Bilamarchaeum dharawalense TaxID=2885759 RepID=A0A5E4LVC5_9ARCH|nr:Uncharacterised protein [Candidatus Bilamarchaeum dharawalense]
MVVPRSIEEHQDGKPPAEAPPVPTGEKPHQRTFVEAKVVVLEAAYKARMDSKADEIIQESKEFRRYGKDGVSLASNIRTSQDPTVTEQERQTAEDAAKRIIAQHAPPEIAGDISKLQSYIEEEYQRLLTILITATTGVTIDYGGTHFGISATVPGDRVASLEEGYQAEAYLHVLGQTQETVLGIPDAQKQTIKALRKKAHQEADARGATPAAKKQMDEDILAGAIMCGFSPASVAGALREFGYESNMEMNMMRNLAITSSQVMQDGIDRMKKLQPGIEMDPLQKEEYERTSVRMANLMVPDKETPDQLLAALRKGDNFDEYLELAKQQTELNIFLHGGHPELVVPRRASPRMVA